MLQLLTTPCSLSLLLAASFIDHTPPKPQPHAVGRKCLKGVIWLWDQLNAFMASIIPYRSALIIRYSRSTDKWKGKLVLVL
jgi:hypothetical protein